MKYVRVLIPVLLIVCLLTGCMWFLPFLSTAEPSPTELPIGSELDPKLSQEDIYWRSKLAFMDRAYAYSLTLSAEMEYSDSEISFPVSFTTQSQILMDPETSAVNIGSTVSHNVDFMPGEYQYQEYYRNEDGRLIYYYYEDDTDYCFREEILLDDQTPYVIILDYTIYGYPIPQPSSISLEPNTRLLEEREVYVLTCQMPVGYVLGYTGNAVTDAQLEQRMVPMTWYVDAQTYQPIRQEVSLSQVDDLIGALLQGFFDITSAPQETYTIESFSWTLGDFQFQPVELPSIPREVLEKAWEDAGFRAA